MRVLVMGSGAIGGYYGGLLCQHGHDVVFVARGEHLAALRERGLELRQAGSATRLSPVTAVATPAEAGAGFDLVLFTVKTYDTAAAIEGLRPAVGPATAVLTLQNGVESSDLLGAAFGAERVLAGTTRISTTLAEPGVILQQNPLTALVIGELTGVVTPRVEMLAAAFREAGVEVTVSRDILVEVWNKFLMLAPHASITSACDAPVGPIRETPEGRALYRTMIAEAVAVGRALGIALAADTEQRILDFIDALPPGGKTSMQIGFERRQRVELEQLTGTIVRRGRALGVPTPAFDTLYAVLTVRALMFGGVA